VWFYTYCKNPTCKSARIITVSKNLMKTSPQRSTLSKLTKTIIYIKDVQKRFHSTPKIWSSRDVIMLKNTCPFDATIQVLVPLFVQHPFTDFFADNAPTSRLTVAARKVKNSCINGEFDDAKSIWIKYAASV